MHEKPGEKGLNSKKRIDTANLNLYNITTKIYISSFNFYAKKYRIERTKRCKNNIMN